MAGNKETPRQRMIGMMYLVLTALLALNVSKEIVNAFIRLNDKIEDSNIILQSKINQDYDAFKMAMAVKHSRAAAQLWDEKAQHIRKQVEVEINYLLNETNALLKETEGHSSNWLIEDKRTGSKKLKSLMEVEAKDDYDAATRLFVGGDPTNPILRGQQMRLRLQHLRDEICKVVGTYTERNKSWKFDPGSIKNFDPKSKASNEALRKAMVGANPKDTAVLARIYRTLSYPLTLTEYDETTSWQGAMFDHAPVVAAVAILTSLRSDIKNAESLAIDHLLSKIKSIIFPINKIEPIAFAPKGYLNVGDTMPLRVMIAAYDSNDVSQIRYAEDDPEMKTPEELTGPITIRAKTPGVKNIYGNIGVREHGELVWKPWSFTYEVGQPTASISATDLNVLFASHPNKVSATASGYSSSDIRLVGEAGVTITKEGEGYIVKPAPSLMGRKVKLTVMAKGKNVGTMEFRVRQVPRPTAFFGRITSTDTKITRQQLMASLNSGLRLGYGEDALITAPFTVKNYRIVIAAKNGEEIKYDITGPAIPANYGNVLRGLNSGASLTIRDIRGTCYGNEVRAAPIVLTVQ